jgi:hypothetical protein
MKVKRLRASLPTGNPGKHRSQLDGEKPNQHRSEAVTINKKFWEELTAYCPLIRHGPHRKRRLQQFFVAAGASSPSCYLATTGGYTDPLTHASNNSYIVACIRCRGNVFTKMLPSNERRDTLYRAFALQRQEG